MSTCILYIYAQVASMLCETQGPSWTSMISEGRVWKFKSWQMPGKSEVIRKKIWHHIYMNWEKVLRFAWIERFKKKRGGGAGLATFDPSTSSMWWAQHINHWASDTCCCWGMIKRCGQSRGFIKSGSVSWISLSVIVLIRKGSVGWKACDNLPGVRKILYGKF